MIDLLDEIETIPASYPNVDPRWMIANPPGDQDPGDQVWQRIESYTRTRYSDRQVIWIIEGMAGDAWRPPLSPVTSNMAEIWNYYSWESVSLKPGPVGYHLPMDGCYRITAQVGGGDIPAAVAEGYRRLHEYSRGIAEQFKGDAAHYSGEFSQKSATWAGKSLVLSGAADALRPYRRQK